MPRFCSTVRSKGLEQEITEARQKDDIEVDNQTGQKDGSDF